MASTVQTRQEKFLKPIRVKEFGFSRVYPIRSVGSLNFIHHRASVVWAVSINVERVFSVKHQLTISLWQSLRRSLSSFVFPIPAPDPFPFVIETKRAQLMDSSSNTDRSIFSAFGSSSSLRECTSDRPSSWGQCGLTTPPYFDRTNITFTHYNEIPPYDHQQALSSLSIVLNVILHGSYSLCCNNINVTISYKPCKNRRQKSL